VIEMKREDEIKRLKSYTPQNGKMIKAEWMEKQPSATNPLGLQWNGVTEFFKVTLKLQPTEKSNITVVVCLPEKTDWNGKFLGTGNGGSAGEIAEMALINGVCRGYAVANTDMGTSKDPDNDIGNQEVMIDFGYRATHLMTVVGKELTEWFYGTAPQYSYFLGGSTGGQQGFSEVQRYPEDYDGVICLSPAFDRVNLHTFFVWNWQQIHKRNAGFTKEQALQWKKCIIDTYRKLCGSEEKDEFLTFPGRISENPMNNSDLCKQADSFLEDEQKEALYYLYQGPEDPVTKEQIIVPFLPGTEAESLSLADMSDKERFEHDFFYLFRWIWGKDFDFMNFDFHKDWEAAVRELSPILDATNQDLREYQEHGGKLLVISGSMDAIIPYKGLLEYYNKVSEKMGGLDKVMDFFRFFLMPGFAHTIGGSGVQDVGMTGATVTPRDPEHDVLCAMEAWVEQGKVPEKLLGTHFCMGKSGLQFDHDRAAYVYPYVENTKNEYVKSPESF